MTDALNRLKDALADRYTIEREIGSGGMATVYLAEDLKLHRKVALKVLRPELASALGPDRFLQEIDIAAKLSHPHILPLHDCGEADGFLYYVMTYVEGQSLRDKLAKEGELPIAEAVRILRDVVDALSHAHKHNVVHRDIKPDNVMLSDRHALVTDFGVAKAVSEATGAHKLTTEGVALGTPAYMAPEQAAADPHIDHRADIYAVGVIAYELLTGRTPFVGNTQQELLAAHVTQTPDPLTKYRESVPPALAELVMKCLEKKAADRWQTADELLPHLEALATPSGGVTPAGMRPVDRVAKRRWVTAGMAVGAAAVVAVIVVMAALPRGSRFPLDPNLVVVAVFRNETGDSTLAAVGKQAGHGITQGLQGSGVVHFTPWEMVLQSSEYLQDEVEAGRVRNRVLALAEETGAGVVISGAYYVEGENLRIQVDVTDATEGRLIGSVEPVVGSPDSPSDLIRRLQQQVLGFLAITFDERLATTTHLMGQLPTYEAYQAFAEGMEEYAFDFRTRAALPHFYRAFELDSTFFTALIYASIQHSNVGEPALADSLLRVLTTHGDQLSEYDRHWVQYFRAYIAGNHQASLRPIRRAAELAPRSKAVYNLSVQLEWVNRPREVLDVLARLDPERGAMRGWWMYWWRVINALHLLGEHTRELEQARKARQQYPGLSTFVYAEVVALTALGRVGEARELLTDVEQVLPLQHVGVGVELHLHGHPAEAREVLDWTVQWLRMNPPEEAAQESHRYYLAFALYLAEQWDEARQLFEGLFADFDNIVNYPGYPSWERLAPDYINYLGHLGVIAARLDDREMALHISSQLAELTLPFLRGGHTAWRARIAAVLGQREEAVGLLREAYRQGSANPLYVHYDLEYESLRDFPPFQELMRPKG